MIKIKNKIPYLLIYSRLVLGFAIISFSAINLSNYNIIAIILLTIGLLTDIFDGIIARRIGISSERLRRLDSNVDQVFFISFAIATYIHCSAFFLSHLLMLSLLLGSEAIAYIICYVKFRKEIATHSIGAKFWTLILFATLIEITVHCQSTLLFSLCIWIGIITRLEIMAILFVLKKWANDVPSIYHAIQLRKGKTINRHSLFNG